MAKSLISVGVITGAHGIKGEVKLKSFTSDPAAIATYGPLTSKSGESFTIAKLRGEKDGFIASFKGVNGPQPRRSAARHGTVC